MSYVRTPEHRALRAELIRRWKPWELSTGPKTLEGKVAASKRGDKGGIRPLVRELSHALRAQQKFLKEMASIPKLAVATLEAGKKASQWKR